jgi:hypothetical protein
LNVHRIRCLVKCSLTSLLANILRMIVAAPLNVRPLSEIINRGNPRLALNLRKLFRNALDPNIYI